MMAVGGGHPFWLECHAVLIPAAGAKRRSLEAGRLSSKEPELLLTLLAVVHVQRALGEAGNDSSAFPAATKCNP